MNLEIKEILEQLSSGKLSIEETYQKLKFLPFKKLENIHLDTHRKLRTNIEEIIFGQNKSIEELQEIIENLLSLKREVCITKLDKEKGNFLEKKFPEGNYYKNSGIFLIQNKKELKGKIAVISAGTSDIFVAEEAKIIAEFLGSKVETFFDVGVAGLHRLLEYKEKIEEANILIVIAGMEGALPSIVAGLFGKPIVAVPTSVGYGVHFNGVAPLLTMLNSCALGIVVVNINNGFGAAVFAHMINERISS